MGKRAVEYNKARGKKVVVEEVKNVAPDGGGVLEDEEDTFGQSAAQINDQQVRRELIYGNAGATVAFTPPRQMASQSLGSQEAAEHQAAAVQVVASAAVADALAASPHARNMPQQDQDEVVNAAGLAAAAAVQAELATLRHANLKLKQELLLQQEVAAKAGERRQRALESPRGQFQQFQSTAPLDTVYAGLAAGDARPGSRTLGSATHGSPLRSAGASSVRSTVVRVAATKPVVTNDSDEESTTTTNAVDFSKWSKPSQHKARLATTVYPLNQRKLMQPTNAIVRTDESKPMMAYDHTTFVLCAAENLMHYTGTAKGVQVLGISISQHGCQDVFWAKLYGMSHIGILQLIGAGMGKAVFKASFNKETLKFTGPNDPLVLFGNTLRKYDSAFIAHDSIFNSLEALLSAPGLIGFPLMFPLRIIGPVELHVPDTVEPESAVPGPHASGYAAIYRGLVPPPGPVGSAARKAVRALQAAGVEVELTYSFNRHKGYIKTHTRVIGFKFRDLFVQITNVERVGEIKKLAITLKYWPDFTESAAVFADPDSDSDSGLE